MATIKTKDTLVRAGLKSGSDWITFSGEFSGMDPPEFAPDSDTRVVPSQSDYENTMSTGLKRASLTLTVDLRDGMDDPGSTIPILSTWTASVVVWQIGWGARNTETTGNNDALLAGKPMVQFEQVVQSVAPTADGGAWRLTITGPARGAYTYGNTRAGTLDASGLPAGFKAAPNA